MKLRPELFILLQLFSCVYDPPQKGKEVAIYNQTGNPVIILDSLDGNYLKLYDTAMVNGRRYITRHPNYLTDYGHFQTFYSNIYLSNLKSSGVNKIKLFFIGTNNLQNILGKVSITDSVRSFSIDIDTLNKYSLNHLFIANDSIFFEHEFSYLTIRK